jgi:hypothetical protein
MKTKTPFIGLLAVFFFIFYCSSCTQKSKKAETEVKIENTFKSVTLLSDSIGIDPSVLLSHFERLNKAIDSIGYPDAGFKLWIVQSDNIKDLRFMIEGNWPNQAIHDTIRNNELYKNITPTPEEKKLLSELKRISYNLFTLVK